MAREQTCRKGDMVKTTHGRRKKKYTIQNVFGDWQPLKK